MEVLPRYYFSDDYRGFYPLFASLPHRDVTFRAGDILWGAGEPITRMFYFRSGLVQAYVEHEDGHRKNLSFHGPGTVFPGFQKTDFKIEKSILMRALTDTDAMAFDRCVLQEKLRENAALMERALETSSAYVNMLIYEAAHQKYNDIFLKLCNFLFLMSRHAGQSGLSITQETIADTLGVGRNRVTKCLSRLREEQIIRLRRRHIEIADEKRLAAYCSLETRGAP